MSYTKFNRCSRVVETVIGCWPRYVLVGSSFKFPVGFPSLLSFGDQLFTITDMSTMMPADGSVGLTGVGGGTDQVCKEGAAAALGASRTGRVDAAKVSCAAEGLRSKVLGTGHLGAPVYSKF
jgi:hypothetical protein